jgi:hypothetical protein
MAPRPQLEQSTKKRPSGPRRLSEVELDEDEVLIDGFDAMLEGGQGADHGCGRADLRLQRRQWRPPAGSKN